jgi:hypothetical protein
MMKDFPYMSVMCAISPGCLTIVKERNYKMQNEMTEINEDSLQQ